MKNTMQQSVTYLSAPSLALHENTSLKVVIDANQKIPTGATPTFFHRSLLFDEFDVTGGGSSITQDQKVWDIDIPSIGKRKPGLYILTRLNVTFTDGTEESVKCGLPVEVIQAGLPLSTNEQVEAQHKMILSSRKARSARGIGAGAHTYKFVYFLIDCKVTQPLDLFDFILEPFDNLGNADLARIMSVFLSKKNIHIEQNKIEQILLSYHHAPITLLIFPKVLANSQDEAIRFIDAEAKLINDIVSIQRHGYGEIVGTIAFTSSGEMILRGTPRVYRGNLAGGNLSGEYRTGIYNAVEKIRENFKAKFYLSLYTSAFQEENIEFRYFRMWSLLETVAKNKNYIGKPRLNWNGDQISSKKGKLLIIENQAEQLVFELIRDTWKGKPFSHGSTLEQGEIDQLIKIWYRHRNCVGHRGGCFPEDPSFCYRDKKKFIDCNAAHCEQVKKFGTRKLLSDEYMAVLELVVRNILLAEI